MISRSLVLSYQTHETRQEEKVMMMEVMESEVVKTGQERWPSSIRFNGRKAKSITRRTGGARRNRD
jgi:hypothetical protein